MFGYPRVVLYEESNEMRNFSTIARKLDTFFGYRYVYQIFVNEENLTNMEMSSRL